jgi:hypothetical protein
MDKIITTIKPSPRGPQGGYVLMMTLGILTGIMILGMSMMKNASAGRKIMSESRKGSQSRYAAESAIALIINRAANSVDSNGDVVEFPSSTLNMLGHRTEVSLAVETDDLGHDRVDSIRGKYDLLTFRSYANVDAISTDTTTGSSAHIRQRIAFDQYPIFQFATYWEGTMALDPGSNMVINGRMHCNARVKLFPWTNLSIEDWLTSPCEIWHMASGGSARIRFKRIDGTIGGYMTPPSSFAIVDTPYYGGSNRMRLAYGKGVPVFKMPVGTRNAILIIQPKGVDDKGVGGFTETATSKKQKLIYKADLIYRKRNSLATIVKQWSRNTSSGGDLAVSASLNTSLNLAIDTPSVSGIHRDSLYDYGDAKWMNAQYLNVGKFFTKSTDPTDQVVYLEGRFDTVSLIKSRDVFILYNANTLGHPITFVSNCPIYVWGDYNNRSTKSSALIADIISVLSETWNGSYSSATTTRPGSVDSIYACMLGGVRRARVHTAWNNPTDANYYDWSQDDNSSYSDRVGQPHNHLSFMENFTGFTFTFSGSQVALWRCLYLNGLYRWNPGNSIYSQPNRNFSFDTRYNQLINMPPGTPALISPFNLDYYEVHEE